MHLAGDVVDGVLQRLRPRVEARHGRQHDGAGLGELEQPAQVDLRERRLPRDDDERPPLLEGDVGGAVHERARRAEGDVGRRRHRAGADDDGVRGAAPARGQRRRGRPARTPVRSRRRARGTPPSPRSRPAAASSSSCWSTRTPLSEMLSCSAAAGRRQRLHEPRGVGRSARAADADEHALWWSPGHALTLPWRGHRAGSVDRTAVALAAVAAPGARAAVAVALHADAALRCTRGSGGPR